LKRRDEWRQEVTDAIRELQERFEGFDPRKLAENQMFVTAVAEASIIAIRNHSREKREALRNAIQNSALPGAPDEELQLLFLGLVDTLTPMHLRLLKLFSEPQSHPELRRCPTRITPPGSSRRSPIQSFSAPTPLLRICSLATCTAGVY